MSEYMEFGENSSMFSFYLTKVWKRGKTIYTLIVEIGYHLNHIVENEEKYNRGIRQLVFMNAVGRAKPSMLLLAIPYTLPVVGTKYYLCAPVLFSQRVRGMTVLSVTTA